MAVAFWVDGRCHLMTERTSVMLSKDKAIEAMEDAKEQFPEREFELHEIELQ